MLKDLNSVYKPHARRTGWWKFKTTDVGSSMIDSLDVIILGGQYGKGRRLGISHYLVGVAEPPKKMGVSNLFFPVLINNQKL